MPIQTVPMMSGTIEIAIQSFHLPTKSSFQWISRWSRPMRRLSRRYLVSARTLKAARVATTAVNSDSRTPMPRVKAKPLTPAVANRKRMRAVANVTTLASMIAPMPFL